jgi:hypothetical protein
LGIADLDPPGEIRRPDLWLFIASTGGLVIGRRPEEGSSDFAFKYTFANLSYLGIDTAPALLPQGNVRIKAGRDQVKYFNPGEKFQEQKQGIALIKKLKRLNIILIPGVNLFRKTR